MKTSAARTSPGIPPTDTSFGLPRSAMSRSKLRSCTMARSEPSLRQSGTHLNPSTSLLEYSPAREGLPTDLSGPIGPTASLLAAVDHRLSKPVVLTDGAFDDLLAFVRDSLLDPRARPENLRKLVPRKVPSNAASLIFQFGPQNPPSPRR
jgi:hypothetical protein